MNEREARRQALKELAAAAETLAEASARPWPPNSLVPLLGKIHALSLIYIEVFKVDYRYLSDKTWQHHAELMPVDYDVECDGHCGNVLPKSLCHVVEGAGLLCQACLTTQQEPQETTRRKAG